jgi:hypothetical protein
MATRRSFINILIIRISAQLLFLAFAGLTQQTVAAKSVDKGFNCELASAEQLEAHISEEGFWEGDTLPARQLRLVLFLSTDDISTEDRSCEVLAIVPDLNATYKFRFCSEGSIPEGGWAEWAGTPSQKVAPDTYLATELSRFSDFVAHARKEERILTTNSDPLILFRFEPALKARRIAQIEHATETAFHEQHLKIRIANFSALTHQINVLIPAVKQMVTFSVINGCTGEDKVSIGRELSLGSIRADLRKRIEANSTVSVIR